MNCPLCGSEQEQVIKTIEDGLQITYCPDCHAEYVPKEQHDSNLKNYLERKANEHNERH